MEASRLSRFPDLACRLMAAFALCLALAVTATALAPAPAHAAKGKSAVKTVKARAAAMRSELTVLDRSRAALRVRASLCLGKSTKSCRAVRAALAKADARAAKLRRALGLTPTTPVAAPKPAATPVKAPAATTPSTTPATPPTTSTPSTGPAISDVPVSFQPGAVVWQSDTYDIGAAKRVGARYARMEFPIEASVADLAPVVGNWAANGIRLTLLAGFAGRTPSPAEARNLATWAAAFGPGGTYWATHPGGDRAPELIEFGNETNGTYQYGDQYESAAYDQRARAYALRFKDAALAISAVNRRVGLLAQGEDHTGYWFAGVYAAVPNFHDYVAGWVAHPYGEGWRERLRRTRARIAAHGAPSTIPWDITETGVSVDNGRCVDDNYGFDRCMGYDTAAAKLASMVAEIKADLGPRLRSLHLYRIRDLRQPGATNAREDYFGLQTIDLQDKGAYTAQARAILAQGS